MIKQEPILDNTAPETTTTTTTTTTTIFISPPTTPPQNITSLPVVANQEDIIDKTVQVVAYDCVINEYESPYIGLGSGVLVSDKGHILTNAMCLKIVVDKFILLQYKMLIQKVKLPILQNY